MAGFNVGRPQANPEDGQTYNTGSNFNSTPSQVQGPQQQNPLMEEEEEEELDEFGNPIMREEMIGGQGQHGWGSSMNAQEEGGEEKMGLLKLAMQGMGGGGPSFG